MAAWYPFSELLEQAAMARATQQRPHPSAAERPGERDVVLVSADE
jgi:hypothetical protein